MPWPDDEELPISVLGAFGADLTAAPQTWVWTDLTDRLEGEPIPIRRGASNGAGEASAGTASMLLRNDDGALTPLNPMSEFYPNVDLNTPVMVGLRRIVPVTDSDSFTTPSTNSWGVSDQGRTWTSLSAGGPSSTADFQVAAGVATLSVPTTLAYRLVYLPVDVADVDVAITVSAPVTVTGGPIEPGGILLRFQDSAHYYLFRISAIAGGSIIAEISATGASELLTSATVPGVTWTSGVPLRIRAQAWVTWLRMRVWKSSDPEPTTWALTTTSDDYLSGGGVGIRSGVAPGNSNAKPVVFSHDDFELTELPSIRMDGFADSWEPTFTPTSDGDVMVSGVELTASGILRRLGQGDPDGRSALRRAIDASTPIAYWPMEDGEDSTQAASGLLGGTPATVAAGVMDFIGDGPVGSTGAAQPQLDAENALSGPITGGSATAWQMSVWAWGVGTSPIDGSFVPLEVRTNTGKILRFGMQDASNTAIVAEYDTEAQTTTSNLAAMTYTALGDRYAVDGQWHLLQATFTQVGANTDASFWFDGAFGSSATWAGVTIGAPISFNAVGRFGGPGGVISPDMAEMAITHVAIHNGASPHDHYPAGLGHAGETASDRIARLCDEAEIPCLVDAGESEPLGPQPASRDIEIIRDAARADMGQLTEYLWGLRWRPRSTRYNLTPSMTVDLATYVHPETASPGSILRPVYDDQQIRNDWTVERTNGSSAQAVDAAVALPAIAAH